MAKLNVKNGDAAQEQDSKQTEIVKKAFEVFYRDGFHAAGVNSLLEGTGISKRTLYKYFDSKEDLIRSTIIYYNERTSQNIRDFVEQGPDDAREKILRIFDWYENVMASGHKQGCFAIKAKLEFAGQDKKIENACEMFFSQGENFIEKLCREARLKNPKTVAKQIRLIFHGSIVASQIDRNAEPVRLAKLAARSVLNDA